jgi:hypothetical protein
LSSTSGGAIIDPDTGEQQDATKPERKVRLRDVSTITAIASLVVALIFNGLQVHSGAEEANAARRTTELQLLTQLNALVAESQSEVEPQSHEIERAERDEEVELSASTQHALGRAVKDMDYLAWLYNNHFVDIPGSRQLWSRRMTCVYVTAVLLYGASAEERVENLKRFVNLPEYQSRERLEERRERAC